MNYIKKIEISDFRGFDGNKTLDFEDASIVLFLGLNGFGKTSIFDAVEWCLTGKIGRYEIYNTSGRKQDFNKEKEVLRNKYATSPNTEVKVELTNGIKFGRRVINSNNESDYNLGSTINGYEYGLDSICKEKISTNLANDYFTATHLLSQETISHFITTNKPDERYKALSVNFGTALFSPFEKNIQETISLLSRRIEDTKKDIKAEKEFLEEWEAKGKKEFDNLDIEIQKANELITKVNDLSNKPIISTLVFKNDEIDIHSNLYDQTSELINQFQTNITKIELRSKNISFLQQQLPTWNTVNEQLKTLKENLDALNSNIKNIHDLRSQKEKLEYREIILKEQLDTVLKEINKIDFVNKGISHFIETLTFLNKKENAITNNLLEYNENQAKFLPLNENLSKDIQHHNSLLNTNLSLEDLKQKFEFNKTILIEYNESLEKITEDIFQKEQLLKSTKDGKDFILQLLTKLKRTNEVLDLKHIFSEIQFNDNIENLVIPIKELLTNQEINFQKKIDLKTKNKSLSDLHEHLKEQLTSKKKLLTDSISFINKDSRTCPCPVCNTGFATVDLLQLIEEQLNENTDLNIKAIADEIDLIDKESLLCDETIQRDGSEIKRLLNTLLQHLNSYIENIQIVIEQQNDYLNSQKTLKESLITKYEKLILQFNTTFNTKYNGDYEAALLYINERIAKLNQEIKLAKDNITEKENFRDSISNRNIEISGSINQLKLEINSLQDSNYELIKSFLIEYNIDLATNNIDQRLNEIQQTNDQRKLNLEKDLENTGSQILETKNILDQLLNEATEDILLAKQTSLLSSLEEGKEFIDNCSRKCFEIGINPGEYKNDILITLEAEHTISLKDELSKKNSLESLQDKLKKFVEFNNNKETRKVIKEYQKKIDESNTSLENLNSLEKSFKKLNHEFPVTLSNAIKNNLDEGVFNAIYKSLSPHRRFDVIDFRIDVNRNHIGIHFDAKQSKVIARPEFLFSSAQLNTFGICMFLSMALRQNWLDLDTILIDDPIQNLDDINVLSFIDFIRGLIDVSTGKKQIILSTHDERFYDLMIQKFQNYKLKTFKFESYGKILST